MTLKQLQLAQDNLKLKLLELDLDAIEISDYTREYLRSMVQDLEETLGRFTQVIHAGLKSSNNEIETLSILEFGGGAGLLSLLALEAGAKEVVYNDIFLGSCEDVKKIAGACNLELSDVICGSHIDLVNHLNEIDQHIDLVLSYDVIEHVYDVSEMLLSFSKLKSVPRSIVFGSGANIKNPFYVRHVRKIQIDVELNDRKHYVGHKERDSLASYLTLRKKMILTYRSDLSDFEIELLATNSRGLIKSDIEKLVDSYCDTKIMNYTPIHPTNTCDPVTGNWCEQLIDHKDLVNLASRYFNCVEIRKGRYSVAGLNGKNLKRHLMNAANVMSLRMGFAFSPFYVLIIKQEA